MRLRRSGRERGQQQGSDQNLKTTVVLGTHPHTLTRMCTFLRDCDIIRLSVTVASQRGCCGCVDATGASASSSAGSSPLPWSCQHHRVPPPPPPPSGPGGSTQNFKTSSGDSSSQEKDDSSEAHSALNASSERCARVWQASAGGREVQARAEGWVLTPATPRTPGSLWITSVFCWAPKLLQRAV